MPNIETARTQVLATHSYDKLDCIVKASLDQAMEFMMALREIKRRKLYTEGGFTTWAEYCQSRLNWTPQWANSQIHIAEMQQKHGNMSGKAAIALRNVEESKQAEVVAIARERQGSGITVPMIQDIAHEISPTVDDTKESDELWEETLACLRAALVSAGKLVKCSEAVHLDRNYVVTMIKNAGVEVSQAKPYSVCYGCKGHGCDRCRDAGVMTKAMWNNRPEEFRSPDDNKWILG